MDTLCHQWLPSCPGSAATGGDAYMAFHNDRFQDLEIIMDASAEPPPRQPGYGRPGMPRGPNQTPTRRESVIRPRFSPQRGSRFHPFSLAFTTAPPTQSALTSEYTPLSRDGLGRSPAQFLSPQKTGLSPAPTPTARAAPPNQHPGLLRQESSEAGEVRASPRPGALVSSDDVPEGPPPPVPSTAPRLDLSPGAEALQLPAGSGKSIYDVDIESLDEKPWRKPGADLTDYFNYGFNEESWRAYARKKSSVVEQRIEAEKEDEEVCCIEWRWHTTFKLTLILLGIASGQRRCRRPIFR